VTSQVSHPYNSTDFTQALYILILVSFCNDLDSHTFLSLENDPLALCILNRKYIECHIAGQDYFHVLQICYEME